MVERVRKLGYFSSTASLYEEENEKTVIKEYKLLSELKWLFLSFYCPERKFLVSGSKRLKNEARMTSLISKLGIKVPEILEIDSEEKQLKMEYIKGRSLRECLDKDYLREAGSIVKRLHSNDLVLKDCRPDNFRINEFGLYLTDLEQACLSDDTSDKAWDLTQFLSFMAHECDNLEENANEFLSGYEGEREVIKKVGRWKDMINFPFYSFMGFKAGYLGKLSKIKGVLKSNLEG